MHLKCEIILIIKQKLKRNLIWNKDNMTNKHLMISNSNIRNKCSAILIFKKCIYIYIYTINCNVVGFRKLPFGTNNSVFNQFFYSKKIFFL